jgi:transposase-like protein
MRACDALDRLSRLGLETLMVLAHRSGMRLGELLKLRLMDIEPSVERWAFIRPNRHGDNKSGSARRKAPLAALLTQNEGVLLERYMSLRAGQADGPAELLFHVPGAPHTPWDPWRVSGMVAGLLRRASGSDAFVFHHYRHTALSLLHLVLEGADDWANRLGGVSAEHAARIRLAVTGRDKPGRDRYWALARLAGHSSPETTFGSYLHFCDVLIGERLTRGAQALPANAWRQITGFTANKLTRVVNAGDVADKSVNTEIPAGVLRPAILGALGGAMVAIGSDMPVDVSEELAPPKIAADMADIALRALARLERGMPITTVAYEFGVDEEQLVRWRDNARAIAARTTRRGGCRHIARERSLRQRTEILLPGRPRSHAEKAEASALIQNLRTMYKSRRDDLIWAIRYVLSNSDSSDSGVRFEQADDLGRFLALFDGLFPTSRWSATCRLPLVEAAPSTGLWRGVLGNIGFAENRDRRHHGRRQLITLRLTHPNEARVLHRHRGAPKGYAATTLRYVFHVLGIMLGGGDAN